MKPVVIVIALLTSQIFEVTSFTTNLFRSSKHSSPCSQRAQAPDDGETGPSVNASSTTYYSPNIPLVDKVLSEQSPDEYAASIESSANEYSFFDEATIYVRAGSGGQGASTFKKGVGGQDGPPDGGNGGRGGNVVLIVDESLNTLAGLTHAWRPNSFGGSGAASSNTFRDQRKSFRAENGVDGGRQLKSGKFGKEVTIRVPPGTVVHELIEHEDGSEELTELGSLILDEQPSLIVAYGGEGGEGSGINSKGRGVRRPRIPPQGGERKTLRLTLKIVADVALVGVPNAGKSTFLSAVTRAKPKIANVSTNQLRSSIYYKFDGRLLMNARFCHGKYPFTTVIPNLGVWIPAESDYGDEASSRGGRKRTEGSGGDGLVLCVSEVDSINALGVNISLDIS